MQKTRRLPIVAGVQIFFFFLVDRCGFGNRCVSGLRKTTFEALTVLQKLVQNLLCVNIGRSCPLSLKVRNRGS